MRLNERRYMGQAKFKRDRGIQSKRFRFVYLMRLISNYDERMIKRFAEIRRLK